MSTTGGQVGLKFVIPSRRAFLRLITLAAFTGACIIAGRTLLTHRSELSEAVGDMGVAPVVLSLAFAILATLANWPVWRSVLSALRVELPASVSARLFYVSQIGKYLPGAIWPIVAQTEVGRGLEPHERP